MSDFIDRTAAGRAERTCARRYAHEQERVKQINEQSRRAALERVESARAKALESCLEAWRVAGAPTDRTQQ